MKPDSSRQRIGRTAHGYAAQALGAGGIYRRKPAESPQAVVEGVAGFGKCETCYREKQELYDGRCFYCRMYGFGGKDEDE